MENKNQYRGKRVDGEGWVCGSLVNNLWVKSELTDDPMKPICEIVASGDGSYDSWEDVIDGYVFEVIPETVGRLYGHPDRNGNLIWEGDLIEVERRDDKIVVECKFGTIERQMATGFLCDITGFYFEREDGCQTFPIKKNYKDGHDHQLFSVIGNVFDNPELLNRTPEMPDLGNMEYRGPSSHCKACEDEKAGIKHIQAPMHTCRKRKL
jgi:hypothetical protein